MSTVKNLDINLRVKDGEFSPVLKKATSVVEGFSGATLGAMGALAAGIAAAAAAATAAVTAMAVEVAHAVHSQIEQVSEIVDASNRLGIGTEALIGFQHASIQAGGSAEAMNGALETMSKNVALAAAGLGKARKSIAALGIDAVEFNKLPLDEKLLQLADALDKIENPADKVRHAMAIFGDPKIINALEGGRAGVKKMMDEAKKLGLTLEDSLAANIEKSGDALATMGQAIDGAARQLTAVLAPAVTAVANGIADALTGIRQDLFKTDADFKAFAMRIQIIADNIVNIFKIMILNIGIELSKITLKVGAMGKAILKIVGPQGDVFGIGQNLFGNFDPKKEQALIKKMEKALGEAGIQLMAGLAKAAANQFGQQPNNKKNPLALPNPAKKVTVPEGHGNLTADERGSASAVETIAKAQNQRAENEMIMREIAQKANDKLDKIADKLQEIEDKLDDEID